MGCEEIDPRQILTSHIYLCIQNNVVTPRYLTRSSDSRYKVSHLFGATTIKIISNTCIRYNKHSFSGFIRAYESFIANLRSSWDQIVKNSKYSVEIMMSGGSFSRHNILTRPCRNDQCSTLHRGMATWSHHDDKFSTWQRDILFLNGIILMPTSST